MGRRLSVLLSVVLLSIMMLSGCTSEKKIKEADWRSVQGRVYDAGTFRVLVPQGWDVLPVCDQVSQQNIDSLYIIKGGVTKEGLFEKPQKNTLKPHVWLSCNKKVLSKQELEQLLQDKDSYQEVVKLPELKLGTRAWHGYTAEAVSPMHGRHMKLGQHAYLWQEQDAVQYAAIVKFKYDGKDEKISLNDKEVQAILASVETCVQNSSK